MSRALCIATLIASAWAADINGQAGLAEQARKAEAAMRSERYAEAAEIYRAMARALPNEPGLRLNLGLALFYSGRHREAVEQLESIRTTQWRNPKYCLLLGVGYLKLNEPHKAIAPLRQAVSLDPSNESAQLELADALLEGGDYEASEKAFGELSRQHPDLPKVWEGLALSRLSISRAAFDELVKMAPESSFRYGLAAVAMVESGHKDKAAELYRKALAGSPPAPWMQKELATLENGSTEPTRAYPSWDWPRLAKETAHQQTPEALYWRSRAYSALARESLAKLASMPPTPELHEMMARAYSETGKRAEAVAELREAVRLSPGDGRIQGKLAEALWAARQYEEAISSFQALLAANPEQPVWHFELGDSLFNSGRTAEALPHLRTAVALAPALLPAQAKLGEVLLRSGDAAAALPHLELAQAMDTDGSIHFQLATAYRRVGKVDRANQALRKQKEIQSQTHPEMP